MTDDLLAELRRHQQDYPSLVHGPLCGQAADEIERLRAASDRAPGGDAPSDKQLWEAGCITRQQASLWDDYDLAKHPEGIRKSLKHLFGIIDSGRTASLPPDESAR